MIRANMPASEGIMTAVAAALLLICGVVAGYSLPNQPSVMALSVTADFLANTNTAQAN